MLTKQIESAQKKVEEQNFLTRKRVLEYDDVMNEQRRVVYKYRREILEGRDMGEVAREQMSELIRGKVGRVHAVGRLRGVGPARPGDAVRDRCGRWPRTSARSALELEPRGDRRAPRRRRPRRLRGARGGVRRGADAGARAPHPAADHRHALEGASARDGLPARGHPPPRVRPDRPARRLQERGLPDVRVADGVDLGGVHAADLPRQRRAPAERGRGAVRRAPRSRPPSTIRAAPPSRPALGPAGRGDAAPAAPRRQPHRRSASRRAARPSDSEGNAETVVKTDQEKIGRNDPCWCGAGRSTRSATAPDARRRSLTRRLTHRLGAYVAPPHRAPRRHARLGQRAPLVDAGGRGLGVRERLWVTPARGGGVAGVLLCF